MYKKKINKKIVGSSAPKKSIFGSSLLPTNILDKAYDFFFGELPFHVSQLLRNKGSLRIVDISYICREPINSIIDKLFNVLSLGKFDEAKKKLGYDDMFHLYLVLKLENGESIRIEKNQDINIITNPQLKGDILKINLNDKKFNLAESLENTRKVMGKEKFIKYDAFNNNCQDFVLAWMKGNGLIDSNQQAVQFIKQKADELLKQMPQYISTIANTTTQTGSYINRFLSFISGGRIGFIDGGLIEAGDGFRT